MVRIASIRLSASGRVGKKDRGRDRTDAEQEPKWQSVAFFSSISTDCGPVINQAVISSLLLAVSLASVAQQPSVIEPPIPRTKRAEIAQLAAKALAENYITEEQYQNTLRWLDAEPCKDIDRSLTAARRFSLAKTIKKRDKWRSVEVLESLRLGAWHILRLGSKESEDGYLFYPSDPNKVTSLQTWGGIASVFETADIEQWVIDNVPGIPSGLAACFAWHVTIYRY
jgi:hypothetical protein